MVTWLPLVEPATDSAHRPAPEECGSSIALRKGSSASFVLLIFARCSRYAVARCSAPSTRITYVLGFSRRGKKLGRRCSPTAKSQTLRKCFPRVDASLCSLESFVNSDSPRFFDGGFAITTNCRCVSERRKTLSGRSPKIPAGRSIRRDTSTTTRSSKLARSAPVLSRRRLLFRARRPIGGGSREDDEEDGGGDAGSSGGGGGGGGGTRGRGGEGSDRNCRVSASSDDASML